MKIGEVMSSPAVVVGPDSKVTDVAVLLAGKGFTAVPVVDGNGALIGIVTEADLLDDRLRSDPRIHGRMAPPRTPPATEVGAVMSAPPESVTADDDAADIEDFLDSAVDRTTAERLAAAVPGVVSVRARHQTPDPF